MADRPNNLTLNVDGEVTTSDFREVVDAFVELVDALTFNKNPDVELEWAVGALRGGSAFMSFYPLAETAEQMKLAEDVEQEYDHATESAASGRLDEYGDDVSGPIIRIANVLNGRIPKITFATGKASHDVIARIEPQGVEEAAPIAPLRFRDYIRTSLRGRIVNLSDRKGFSFTLEEDRTERQVRCYPSPKDRHKVFALAADMRWILVEGTFKRHSTKGTMSQITDIVAVDDGGKVDWRAAIGCAPRRNGGSDETSGDAVRRLRDG